RRKPLEFKVGDRVLLKVSLWKGVVRFGKKGKLAPRYVGAFEIIEMIDLVAYRLRLHEELSSVHDTFHVSNLKKCLVDANLHVPLNEIKVDKTLHFVEEPVEIMKREIKKLKRRNIAFVKISSLIPLSRGSFDVLVGMDRLSKTKFGIVCHGKVVRIPLEGDEILQVHGEPTPVAKSPYRLAPLEMQELSEQLQKLQDEELELLRKEKLYAKVTLVAQADGRMWIRTL
ncbi:hypothetical protein Tco_1245526, partial [Tanacetum coccineum]